MCMINGNYMYETPDRNTNNQDCIYTYKGSVKAKEMNSRNIADKLIKIHL